MPRFSNEPLRQPPRPTVQGIFNDLVEGENAPAFQLIETLVNTMLRDPAPGQHFGLFGPASCGKTTTAEIIAKALGRPYFGGDAGYFNANPADAGFIDGALFTAHNQPGHLRDLASHTYFKDETSALLICQFKPTVIFIDEAHELNAANQNALLSMMEKPYRTHGKTAQYDWRDVTIILATTDSSQLVKPLRTRCHEVTFEAYSAESVAEIVEKTVGYTGDLAMRIALAAKMIPRRAIQIARILDPKDPEDTLSRLYAIDDQGLDARDRKILAVLRSSVTAVDQVKLKQAQRLLCMAQAGAKIPPSTLAKAESIIEVLQPTLKPIGLVNLADRLGLTDQRDLQDRVNALVNRGYVNRTARGIVATT